MQKWPDITDKHMNTAKNLCLSLTWIMIAKLL